MDDLEEARRLMSLVANEATSAGPIDAVEVIQMAKVFAHIALAETARQQTAQLERIANALEELAKRGNTP